MGYEEMWGTGETWYLCHLQGHISFHVTCPRPVQFSAPLHPVWVMNALPGWEGVREGERRWAAP